MDNINEKLKKYIKMFDDHRPANWESIPDIDLYMDQVVNYMKRQHIGLEINENLTSSMVNNYVKQEVMPRAIGKKYNREHIVYLTAICLLKQVISIDDTKLLLDNQLNHEDIRTFYEKYAKILDNEIKNMDNLIRTSKNENELYDLALRLAISSYTQKLACECIIDSLFKEEE